MLRPSPPAATGAGASHDAPDGTAGPARDASRVAYPAARQAPARRASRRPPARGATALEVICVLAVLGILAALALPSLQQWVNRQALLASANELESDLQFARAAALARQQVVRLVVQPAGSGNCYLLHTGAPGACRCADVAGGPSCTPDAAVLRINAYDPRRVLALTATRESVAFDPRYGTVTPTTTLRLTDPEGTAIHAVMNVMGRVRACSPGGRVPGYPSC